MDEGERRDHALVAEIAEIGAELSRQQHALVEQRPR
jgi:hypothetical protein